MVARQTWNESLLAQLLQNPERAGARDGLIERIVRGYIIGILAVATAAGLGWWIGTGDALRTWAVVTAVLVVSCPCAVALAFPLADEMATVALRRRGVFVREGGLWTKLGRVRRIVFDKTGTLTLETPVLKNPEAIRALSPEARAALHGLVYGTDMTASPTGLQGGRATELTGRQWGIILVVAALQFVNLFEQRG
jgi:Cu2+-exporting ATPase